LLPTTRQKEHFWMLRGAAHTTWCITRVPTFLFYLAKYIIAPRANMIINNNNKKKHGEKPKMPLVFRLNVFYFKGIFC